MTTPARRNGVRASNGWYCRFGDGQDATRRLVCFHHAGGGASAYREWPRDCAPHTEVIAASLPGRENRLAEPPIDCMEALAGHLADTLPMDKPFAFFGHSFGAFVAFAVARLLAARGDPQPEHLFVSACRAPHRPTTETSWDLDDVQLGNKIFKMGGTPREVIASPEFAAMLFPALRADLRIADTYFAPVEGPRAVPITVYAGSRDAAMGESDLAAWAEHGPAGRFARRTFEGDHFYLVPHRGGLIADMFARWPSTRALHAETTQAGIEP